MFGEHTEKLVQEATELGNCRKRLRTRLQGAVGALDKLVAHKFKKATFDFDKKQLVSNCGTLCLQWEPGQSSRLGDVHLLKISVDANSAIG
jgi:hypothetical protein